MRLELFDEDTHLIYVKSRQNFLDVGVFPIETFAG